MQNINFKYNKMIGSSIGSSFSYFLDLSKEGTTF